MPDLIVAVVGDNTIDRYVTPRGLDYVGGNAVNVAVQLAERGVEVHYFGAVGTDDEGARIREELVARDVRVEGLAMIFGATALTLISIDENGDRHIIDEHFGVTMDYYPTDAEIHRIAGADWVQIGMVSRATELRKALRAVRPIVRIGQDCSVADGYTDLTVAFESSDEDRAGSVVTSARSHGVDVAVVTLGENGSMAGGPGDDLVTQPALPIDAIDTTGAGDSFIAGFVATYLQSPDVTAAMRAGATWAARTCTHVAGFPQDPGPPGNAHPMSANEGRRAW